VEYFVPNSIAEALRQVGEEVARGRRARFVAGGTDLAVQMADGAPAPDALVDLSGLSELRGIRLNRQGLRIGAAVTIEELALRTDLPACLVQGARAIGSPQIRCLGTIGGNLCNASPCGDTLTPVIALDGRLMLLSEGGRREVPAEDFFTGPKATVLREGELLSDVLFGAQALRGGSAFRMIGKRNGQAISQVNVAVWLECEPSSGAIRAVRAAAGSVAPTPIRLARVEALLRGQVVGEELERDAASAAAEEIRPISDVRASAGYRRAVTAALLREALAQALAEARAGRA
jgi:CO/xanthine dehydrogenase FAD-binding subunit